MAYEPPPVHEATEHAAGRLGDLARRPQDVRAGRPHGATEVEGGDPSASLFDDPQGSHDGLVPFQHDTAKMHRERCAGKCASGCFIGCSFRSSRECSFHSQLQQ
jgi:hypothetical protein